MGAYLALSRAAQETRYETAVLVAYILGLVGLAGWQGRAARSWPRHARRASHLGLGATVVLFSASVMVFNYREAHRLGPGGRRERAAARARRRRRRQPDGRGGPAHPPRAPLVSTDGATSPGHARHRLDDVIHAPVRFSIVATLAAVDEAEFALVRDEVEVSDSVLSKQVSTLEQAGYVRVRKGYVGKRPRTWLSLTTTGRQAYASHLSALREIAGG